MARQKHRGILRLKYISRASPSNNTSTLENGPAASSYFYNEEILNSFYKEHIENGENNIDTFLIVNEIIRIIKINILYYKYV